MTTETPVVERVSEERVFRALSDSHRRELLDLLFTHDGQTLSELDSHLPMTRFGTMKHLRMLEAAGLVTTRRAGRKKLHFLDPGPIREVHERWIRKYAEPRNGTAGATHAGSPSGARLRHEYEMFVRATPVEVWNAISSPESTRHFFRGTRVECVDWQPGARIRYLDAAGKLAAEGMVVEADSPRRLVHTFSALWDPSVIPDRPHRVTWSSSPVGGVCRVQMVSEDFDGETATFRWVTGGTSLILNGLKTLLETGEPLPGVG